MATFLDPGVEDEDFPGKQESHHVTVATDRNSLAKEETEKADGEPHSSDSSITGSAGDPDVEKAAPVVAVTDEKVLDPADPNVIDWDGDDDPENPQNWTSKKKWTNVATLSFLTLLTPLASSMFAPGINRVEEDFGPTSNAILTFVVSIYILGFAFGPIVLAPISEMFGRLIVYNVSNVLFLCFTVGCALSTSWNMLIGFRFLAGCLGVAPITLGGGTIADLMAVEQRGAAMAIWAIGPLLGPVIGPVAGGFLSDAEGWRWIFWLITIAYGAASIVSFLVMRESYAPIILERKAKKLRKETGNENLRSKLDTGESTKNLWKRSLIRPAKLMFLSPICALMSLYLSVAYGILYLLFTTFTFVFEGQYGFSESIVGLVYIGLGVGMLLGLGIVGGTSDRILTHLVKKNGGKPKAEYRLPMLVAAGPFIPVGLFIYGWTVQYKVFWIVPILGTTLVGIGMLGCFMCINTYLIDAYTRYAASALAANTVLRSIFGAVFPLFALQMYQALGLGWGNSLLAFVALALVPVPFVFYLYGEKIRTHPQLQVKL